MDAISQTPFSGAFYWMNMYELWLKIHWSLFLRVQLTIYQHWLRYWLGAVQATSHYLNQCWLVYRHIYASLGLNELTHLFWMAILRTIIFESKFLSKTSWYCNILQEILFCRILLLINRHGIEYCQTSNIRHTKYKNLNVSSLVFQLSSPYLFKPGVKSRMKMWLEQRRQAMLQLHLSDQQFYCQLRCDLY